MALNCRRRSFPGGGELARGFQFFISFAVAIRPRACAFSWGKLAQITVLIEAFYQTVDPSETQRFPNGILIRNCLKAGGRLIVHEPYARTGSVVLLEPRTPLPAAAYVELDEVAGHFLVACFVLGG